MKRLITILLILIASGSVAWVVARPDASTTSGYEYTEVIRGDLENIISASGTMTAVGTVEVGTQVSGTIFEVRVDYNEDVAKGQVLAVLDRTMLDASVRDAEAGVLKAQAEYDSSVSDHGRVSDLYEQAFISEADLEDSSTSLRVAEAALISARAALTRAEANLSYAVITSPIDGTVIMRSIEPGQTVAASYSTPTLFVIAEDLSRMEIHALVDESDIGEIEEGQTVKFTVEAYLDEEFEGTVRQVWLQPETVQNVVNYTVVVDAENDEGLLLPGMTATTDFLIDETNDVLLVSNTALRVQPTTEMLQALRDEREVRLAEMPDDQPATLEAGPRADSRNAAGSPLENDRAMLWYTDDEGGFRVARVSKGVTDGRQTEVSGDVTEGMEVICGVPEVEESVSESSRNPLAAGMSGPPKGRP